MVAFSEYINFKRTIANRTKQEISDLGKEEIIFILFIIARKLQLRMCIMHKFGVAKIDLKVSKSRNKTVEP